LLNIILEYLKDVENEFDAIFGGSLFGRGALSVGSRKMALHWAMGFIAYRSCGMLLQVSEPYEYSEGR